VPWPTLRALPENADAVHIRPPPRRVFPARDRPISDVRLSAQLGRSVQFPRQSPIPLIRLLAGGAKLAPTGRRGKQIWASSSSPLQWRRQRNIWPWMLEVLLSHRPAAHGAERAIQKSGNGLGLTGGRCWSKDFMLPGPGQVA